MLHGAVQADFAETVARRDWPDWVLPVTLQQFKESNINRLESDLASGHAYFVLDTGLDEGWEFSPRCARRMKIGASYVEVQGRHASGPEFAGIANLHFQTLTTR